jgi:HSP20 family protein
LWANFDRLFEDLGQVLPRNVALVAFPPINVWEDAEAFHIEVEAPGLTQEQVQVSVTNRNRLTIQGERLPEEVGKGRWHRRERGFGRFQRVLELPAPVEADRVEARLENGLLFLTLPKAEEARPRRIAVKSE